MAKKQVRVPTAESGGLISYTSEEGTGPKIKPRWVVVFSVGVIALELLLHLYGKILV